MATQYSNKPIVTNGLVYALDFGNIRSYISGSSTARNLVFDTTNTSVSGSVTLTTSGLLNLSSTSNVLANKTFSELTINNSYTVSTLVQVKAGGVFWNQSLGPSDDAAYLNTTSTGVGHLVTSATYLQGSDFRRGFNADLTQLTHITYRNLSGSFDVFINGVPVNTTGDYGGMLRGSGLNLSGRNNADSFWSGSIGTFQIYNRALTSDEIYSNYLIVARRYGLSTRPKPYTVDENAYLFLSQSGITDPIITSSIDTFVKGLKSSGIWGKMAVIYPFVGTGSSGLNLTSSHRLNLKEPGINAFAYAGTWNGSVSGSTPSGSNTYIDTGITLQSRFPYYVANNYHVSVLSYDTPVSTSYIMGTGMTTELATSTLAGDYGTPAAAYSVRKVKTSYSGALMDVRRSYDNTTSSIGYYASGDLDTGSLLDWTLPGRNTLPGAYSGLAAAYSLRLVSSSYSGSVIDVRRDSDNTTGSIGFTAAGFLDTGSLLAFVTGSSGTGSGFVARWYDQSGNNRHAIQTATGSQPLIVSSGSLVTEGTKPAVKFYTNLGMDTGFTGLVTKSLFIAANTDFGLNRNDVAQRLFSSFTGGGGVGSELILDGQGTGSFRYIDGGATLLVSQTASYQLTTAIRNSTLNLAFNGGSITSGGSPSSSPNTLNYRIGEDAGLSSTETAKSIQEIIFYNNDQSSNRTLIENNINNYYSIYTSSAAGYVAQWYDQSGNNRHATQTATGSQPIIVLSGSIIIKNNKPALSFDGTGSSLERNDNIMNNTGVSVFNVLSLNSLTDRVFAWDFSNATAISNQLFGLDINTFNTAGQKFGFYTSWNAMDSTTSTNLNQNLVTVIANTTVGNNITGSTSYFINNSSSPLTTRSSANTTYQNFTTGTKYTIGKTTTNALYFNGQQQELIFYPTLQTLNREPIEYGINSYYNIYPQTSSFATSSFAIRVASGSVSASLNNALQSGISTAGQLGLITVSRTGSNALTIAKNNLINSYSVPASGALSTNIYLGAINNNGLNLGSSSLNLTFASIGTGLSNSEISTLNSLVRNLQYNLGRLPSTYTVSAYPNAIAAFSLRKLITTYTGSAIDVRRSSDNITSSIGFDSLGNLDTVSLLAFVGSGSSGYVARWYDQSGNNNHIVQTTLNSQPLIVNNGSVVTAQTFQTRQFEGPNGNNNNSLPAIYFNGKTLGLNRTLYSTNQISYYIVYNLGLGSAALGVDGYSVMSTNTEAGSSAWSWYTGGGGPSGYINMFQQEGSARRENFPSSMPKGGTVLYSGYHTGSAYTVFVNNVSKGTNTAQQFGSGSFLTVGSGNAYGFAGSIQEIIFYATGSTDNNTNIQESINTYYQVY